MPRGPSVDPACSADPKISAQQDSDTTKTARPQALDDAGESDHDYFLKRPGAITRTRLPIDGEFPPGVIEPGRVAFVHVFLVSRDPKTNAPGTRARGVFYADSDDDGGTA